MNVMEHVLGKMGIKQKIMACVTLIFCRGNAGARADYEPARRQLRHNGRRLPSVSCHQAQKGL